MNMFGNDGHGVRIYGWSKS